MVIRLPVFLFAVAVFHHEPALLHTAWLVAASNASERTKVLDQRCGALLVCSRLVRGAAGVRLRSRLVEQCERTKVQEMAALLVRRVNSKLTESVSGTELASDIDFKEDAGRRGSSSVEARTISKPDASK